MDYDLWLRLGLRFKMKRIPGTLANYRLWANSKTVAESAGHRDEMLQVVERFLARPDLPPDIAALRNKVRADAQLKRGLICYQRGDVEQAQAHLIRALTLAPEIFRDTTCFSLFVNTSGDSTQTLCEFVEMAYDVAEGYLNDLWWHRQRMLARAHMATAFRCRMEKRLSQARRHGTQAIIHCPWELLKNRGFASLYLELFLGSNVMTRLRRLTHMWRGSHQEA
jgi:tetratricopeptide (TPR) repeat protein